jgi:replicative DNA helicase
MTDTAFPANVELERVVLGEAMLSDDALNYSIGLGLASSDFSHPAHVKIWGTYLDLQNAGQPVTLNMLASTLHTVGRLEEVGGVAYIRQIPRAVATTADHKAHANQLLRIGVRRRLMRVMYQYIEDLGAGEDLRTVMEDASAEIAGLSGRLFVSRMKLCSEIIDDVQNDILVKQFEHGGLVACSASLPTLSRHLKGGFYRGESYYLDADTSVGKSSLAMDCAIHAAKHDHKALIVTFEMPMKKYLQRIIASRTKVDVVKTDLTPFEDKEIDSIKKIRSDKVIHNIGIIDDRTATVERLIALIKSFKQQYGLDLLILDYMQLVKAKHVNGWSTADMHSHVAVTLQDALGELDCAGLFLSQVNRSEAFNREGKKRSMHGMKGSGSFEQSASVVMTLECAEENVENMKKDEERDMSVHILKGRNGEWGSVACKFTPNIHQWREMVNPIIDSSPKPPPKWKQGQTAKTMHGGVVKQVIKAGGAVLTDEEIDEKGYVEKVEGDDLPF